MKANFEKVKVQGTIEGDPLEMDLRKELGNHIWRGTSDISVSDTGRDIYFSDGEIEIPDTMVPEINAIIGRSTLIAPIKRAFSELLTLKDEE